MDRPVDRAPARIPEGQRAESALRRQWESFVASSTELENYSHHPIFESWLRCKNWHVDPYLSRSPIVLPKDRTDGLCEASDLLRAAAPVLEEVAPLLIEAGHVLSLANEEGILLKVCAGPAACEGLDQIGYVAGAKWSEDVTGTNGCGTALMTRQPVHIFGSEHFCRSWHSWACSGAPIFDPRNGRLMGVLEVSAHESRSDPCSLATVVALAGSIETQIEKLYWIRYQHIVDRYHEIAAGQRESAVVALDERLQIIKLSPGAVSLLGGSSGDAARTSLAAGLGLENGRSFEDLLEKEDSFEVPVACWGRDYALTFSAVQVDSKRVGSVVVLNPWRPRGRTTRRPEVPPVKYSFADLIGRAPAFVESLSVARISARNDFPVLITGESGTGKEMVAEAIHHASARGSGPFIGVNCAAIPSELLCSELFGYAEGAYTGAKRSGSTGKFEAAAGGTLFLDEISELSRDAQAALLRVLQEMEITRLGSHQAVALDVRIIAATNSDLHQMVAEKRFRSDLLYRLDVLSIHLPPLRERLDDIEPLMRAFLKDACQQLRRPCLSVDKSALKSFLEYGWPGNVRELKNVIQRAAAVTSGTVIALCDLPPLMLHGPRASKPQSPTRLQQQEKALILEALEAAPGNLSLVAARLGIGRTTLYRKLKKYGLERSWSRAARIR